MPTRTHKESPIYRTWCRMRQRCLDSNYPDYKNYGGRGIRISDEWSNFRIFEKDMLPSFVKGLSIDRIDNDGSYCKENCRWADKKTQVNNSRKVLNCYKISYMGITDTISNWAKYLKIKRRTLGMRIMDYGWTMDRVINNI